MRQGDDRDRKKQNSAHTREDTGDADVSGLGGGEGNTPALKVQGGGLQRLELGCRHTLLLETVEPEIRDNGTSRSLQFTFRLCQQPNPLRGLGAV